MSAAKDSYGLRRADRRLRLSVVYFRGRAMARDQVLTLSWPISKKYCRAILIAVHLLLIRLRRNKPDLSYQGT